MPKLIAAVYVKHPDTHEDLILQPGQSPPPELAALVTNPDAWDEPLPPRAADVADEAPDLRAGPQGTAHEQTPQGVGGAKKAATRRPRASLT
ncbi:hypothetical protein [Streptomyces fractus]|uniref:hypothetical protein n=1 Tax=Streptomyces fractus TaxID=641806 RepID=UPI003CE9E479